MKRIIASSILIVATLLVAACGSTTAIVSSAILTGARVFGSAIGTASEREVLCKYYGEHRAEIETVRTYYKANWSTVPEKDKPALLKINEQLNACDASPSVAVPAIEKTTARALLEAFKRAVAIYRELKVAGVL